MNVISKKAGAFLLALTAGIICTQIPLLGNFHFESAILASLIGACWAGYRAASSGHNRSDLYHVAYVLRLLYTASVPLILLALLKNCFSWHGLGFWIIYPVPSVFFGASVGRLIHSFRLPKAPIITLITLTAIAAGGLLLEFRIFPQVYFFNHVWGGWPGPIYDETVTLGYPALYFRSMTLAWAALLWFIPSIFDQKYSLWIVVGSLIYLLFGYNNLAEQGIISPEAYIQQKLKGVKSTPHFTIYYAQDTYSQKDIERYALLHEYYLHDIITTLEVDNIYKNKKIKSYLYADPWQKKALVGAKYTSYVPVWLRQDQLHIAKEQLGSSLKHELVHVVAKQFGNNLFNASWSIGLIEGLAVAIAGSNNPESTIDQLVAGADHMPDAQQMINSLSFTGFYGGRSTVNYITSGSFIRYLLSNYPVSYFKKAYRSGNISESYPQPANKLVENWHRHLSKTPVDSIDRKTAGNLFSIPSIFEKPCPHTVSETYHHWDRWQFLITRGDTSSALTHLEKAKSLSQNPTIWNTWAHWKLRKGSYREVINDTTALAGHISTMLTRADAHLLAADTVNARKVLESIPDSLENRASPPINRALEGRKNSFQWNTRLTITLKDSIPPSETWERLNTANQLLLLTRAMQQQRWEKMRSMSRFLLQKGTKFPITTDYYNLIEWHIVLGNKEIAQKLLKNLKENAQRVKERKKIDDLLSLIDYSKHYK